MSQFSVCDDSSGTDSSKSEKYSAKTLFDRIGLRLPQDDQHDTSELENKSGFQLKCKECIRT